jgi:hypothetical protein
MEYKKGPYFARFLTYQVQKSSVIVKFTIEESAEEIFPPELLSKVTVPAKNASVPDIIERGFEIYRAKGPLEGIKVWSKNGPKENDPRHSSAANSLLEMQDFYGPLKSYSVVSFQGWSPLSKSVNIVMEFEKGPVFARFLVHQMDQQWILSTFKLDSEAPDIFLSNLHAKGS